MRTRCIAAVSCALSLVALTQGGCGGSGGGTMQQPQTNLVFDLEQHHYALTHAYYSVLGTAPSTTYTLSLSQLDCETTARPNGSDVDLQIFKIPSGTTHTVKIEFPDPAARGTYVDGGGTVTLDEEPPQLIPGADYDVQQKAIAAIDVVLTGTVDLQMTGGGQTVSVAGPFSATHCRRTDHN